MNSSKFIIGIAGGIGSGKSTVSRILRLNEYFVFDCDYEAKQIMEKNVSVRNKLLTIIGKKAYNFDGSLNRAYISEQIFRDNDKLQRVNDVVHQEVKKEFIKQIKEKNGKVFIESAILFSSGICDFCQEIWIVDSPLNLRIKRIKDRSKLSDSEIFSRIKLQERELNNKTMKNCITLLNFDDLSLLNEIHKLLTQ